MYPLVLCSLFALGVIIAKGYTLWAAHRRSATVLSETAALMKQGRIDQALQLAAETPGPVAAILYSGLLRLRDRQPSEDIENGVKTTGVVELGFLERGLVILATVSNVAPLLGFLGPVAGMVEASLVAGGIKVALITTAAGLTIAIPVNIAYNFFVTRIDTLIRQMEEGTANVLNTAWDMRPAVAGAPSGAFGTARPGFRPATD